MEVVKEVTHIVPVGFASDKLIVSVRQHPVHKVVILTLEGDDEIKEVRKAVKELRASFRGLKIENIAVDREDVFKAALDILDIIESEVKEGKEVKINITGGMRNIGISAYIAALVSNVEVYTAIPESEEPYVLRGILKIPPFPIKKIPDEQLEIIQKLNDGVDSLDELVSRLNPELKKETQDFSNERSRVSYHIKKLRDDGVVETEKKNKNLSIRRSMLGEIYFRGDRITPLSKEG